MTRLDERKKRILTTHTGSLPRPESLSALLFAKMTRQPYDAGKLARQTTEAVAATVRQQIKVGIDIVSDGEQSKTSFQLYATERLGGITPITPPLGEHRTRENMAFPTFYVGGVHSGSQRSRWACTGPLTYANLEPLKADLENLKAALVGVDPIDVFVPSVSPSSCAGTMENRHYKSDEEHVEAVAEVLRHEYEAIVAAGFCVQIDDPRLAMHYMLAPEESIADARKWAARRIEIMNHALRNVPEERVRHHTCYGINMGPRTSDMEMKHLADLIVKIKARYYSFEMANPRHEHEWKVWAGATIPSHKKLAPGVIDTCSNYIEHPELIAQRIERYAGIVGKDRVIASTDCGFGTFAGYGKLDPLVTWKKLRALREGADIADARL